MGQACERETGPLVSRPLRNASGISLHNKKTRFAPYFVDCGELLCSSPGPIFSKQSLTALWDKKWEHWEFHIHPSSNEILNPDQRVSAAGWPTENPQALPAKTIYGSSLQLFIIEI